MYQYSRAIFLAIRDSIVPDRDGVSLEEARRRVLALCEATVGRLAADPRYFAQPARSLFEEIRPYFTIRDQARVRVAVDSAIGLAMSRIEEARAAHADEIDVCRATTRKGKRCRRTPMPGEGYCPSHRHLARPAHEREHSFLVA